MFELLISISDSDVHGVELSCKGLLIYGKYIGGMIGSIAKGKDEFEILVFVEMLL